MMTSSFPLADSWVRLMVRAIGHHFQLTELYDDGSIIQVGTYRDFASGVRALTERRAILLTIYS
jgi:hypothetical protein